MAADQVIRGTVVGQRRLLLRLQLRDDALGQHLAEFNPPLVEGIHVPDDALRVDDMLVERHQAAERPGCEPVSQNRVRRPIALERLVRHQPFIGSFPPDLIRRFAEGKGFSLRKHIGQQEIMVPPELIQGLMKCDEIRRDEPRALMNQLIKLS